MTTATFPTPFAQATARAAARAITAAATFTAGQRIAAVPRPPHLPSLRGTIVCETGEQRPEGNAIYWVQFDGDRQPRLRFGWELRALATAEVAA